MSTKEAPWKATLLSHLDEVRNANTAIRISLATVTTPSNLPRVRYVNHAGFWSVKTAAHNEMFSSPCPVFVTDTRSNKVAQIFGKPDASPSDHTTYSLGSGGGGPVEATYWLESVKMQWRLRGRCYFVVDEHTTDSVLVEELKTRHEGLAVTKAAVKPHMSAMLKQQEKNGSGSSNALDDNVVWKAEVQGYYQQLSLDLQKSFPRSTFTVGIIVPEEAELMDLTDPTVGRRRIWKSIKETGNDGVKWEIVWDNI